MWCYLELKRKTQATSTLSVGSWLQFVCPSSEKPLRRRICYAWLLNLASWGKVLPPDHVKTIIDSLLHNGKVQYTSEDGKSALYYDPDIYNSTGAFKLVPKKVKDANYDWNEDHQYFNVTIWSGKNDHECPSESIRWQLKGEEGLMYSNGPVVKCLEERKSCRYVL